MKVRVLEVEATKLDPKATYIIVFNKTQITGDEMRETAQSIIGLGIEAVYMQAFDPETAIKIYQIPKVKK